MQTYKYNIKFEYSPKIYNEIIKHEKFFPKFRYVPVRMYLWFCLYYKPLVSSVYLLNSMNVWNR